MNKSKIPIYLNFRGSYSIINFSFGYLWPSKPMVFFENPIKKWESSEFKRRSPGRQVSKFQLYDRDQINQYQPAAFLIESPRSQKMTFCFLTLNRFCENPLYKNPIVLSKYERNLGTFQFFTTLILINVGRDPYPNLIGIRTQNQNLSPFFF